MIRLLVWWALLTGLYFGLISTVAGWELWLGGGLGLIAAAVAVLTRSAERTTYSPAWNWARWLLALPTAIVADTGRLALVVGQRLVLRHDTRGHFRRIQLPSDDSASRERARRALAAAALSATPGSVVADVSTDGVILVHAFGPSGSRLERMVVE